MESIFRTEDIVLADLNLPERCLVEIKITDSQVQLQVGPRDWSWDVETGKFIGSGCCVGGGKAQPTVAIDKLS